MQKNKLKTKKTKAGIVYIVHAVDTEGPMHESLSATFQRIYEHYGINIDPTKKNLELLQQKKFKLKKNLKEKFIN